MVKVSGSVTIDKTAMMKGLGILPSSLPFYGDKLLMERLESSPWDAGGSSKIVFDKTGSGTVCLIWLAQGAYGPLYQTNLKITVDGSVVADVNMATMWPCVHYWLNPWSPRVGYHWTRHLELNINDDYPSYPPVYSVVFRFPIYYQSSCKIEVTNPSSITGGSLFAQIFYTEDYTLPYRLYITGYNWQYQVTGSEDQGMTILGGQTNDLLSISGEGVLCYNSMVAGKQGSFLLLENDVEVYMDNESQPSIKSTGLEDWFLSGWYFAAANGQHPGYYSSPIQTVVVKKGDPDWWLGVAVDLAEAYNGIAFNNQLDVKLDCSESSGFEMGYAFVYYLKV